MKPEKRRVQRITLRSPIEGLANKQALKIIDLSTEGVRIEHPSPLAGRRTVDLRFRLEDEDIVLSCELVRSRLQRSALDRSSIVYCSGLRFGETGRDSIERVRAIVAELTEGRALSSESSLSIAV
jgi:hypothetical protein